MVLDQARISFSYAEFVQLTEDLLAKNQTTGTNHSPAYIHYTRMNLQRMNRIYKNTKITPELRAAI
ncbi:MAG: thioredoxin family protein, partial [Bacteroidota bacterium]